MMKVIRWRETFLWVGALVCLTAAGAWAAGQDAPERGLSAYDPKSLVFVTNRDSNDVAVIHAETDRVVARIPLGDSAEAHMAVPGPDGRKLLVSATGRDRLLLVDLATLEVESEVETGRSPEHFGLTPDGRWAYVGNLADSTVSVIDLIRGEEVERLAGFSEPHGIIAAGGGSKVYVSSFGAHQVQVIEAASRRIAKRLPVGDVHRAAVKKPERYQPGLKGVAHPTLTPDGRFVYAADGDSGEVAVIDTASDRTVATLKVGKSPWRAYASPDGRWMLVPNNGDGTVSVIEVREQRVVATLKGGPDMTGVNFLGPKAYVISRGEGAVYVYDLRTFKAAGRLALGGAGSLETAAADAAGRKLYLASSGEDSVYVIDGATDGVKKISGVGRFPWGVAVWGAASPNYCH